MAKGFVLPSGDNEKGKQAFIELKCHQCHTVAGELLPENVEPSMVKLHLGGEVYRVKTYGQLVTSVIHPNHNLSKDCEQREQKLVFEATLLHISFYLQINSLLFS